MGRIGLRISGSGFRVARHATRSSQTQTPSSLMQNTGAEGCEKPHLHRLMRRGGGDTAFEGLPTSCASKASLRRTGVHSTCRPMSPYSGRDCVKSLRSSYTGLHPPKSPFLGVSSIQSWSHWPVLRAIVRAFIANSCKNLRNLTFV